MSGWTERDDGPQDRTRCEPGGGGGTYRLRVRGRGPQARGGDPDRGHQDLSRREMCVSSTSWAFGMWRRTVIRTLPPRPRRARIWISSGTSSVSCRPIRSVLWRVMPDVVQSVDRPRLGLGTVGGRGTGGARTGLPDPGGARRGVGGRGGGRGGVAPGGVEELAAAIDGAPGLRLDGLMTVAPLAGPYAGRQRAAFERLMEFSASLRADASCCEHGVSRDECGPRTGRGGRSDTCARRHCGTRSPTQARVTSRSKSDHSRKYGHYRRKAGSSRVDRGHLASTVPIHHRAEDSEQWPARCARWRSTSASWRTMGTTAGASTPTTTSNPSRSPSVTHRRHQPPHQVEREEPVRVVQPPVQRDPVPLPLRLPRNAGVRRESPPWHPSHLNARAWRRTHR